MILLIYLLNMCFMLINASKSDSNIVLSGGGGHGCKDSGALVMQNGQKGKKNEKLIIKDDALIMQDSQADGNIVMDGNGNLIWKEGKKSENIVIKGGGGGDCCHQDIHHKEEHVHVPPPHAIPVHFKKKEVHHHHSKEVHHHNDDLGLGSHRRDADDEPDADISAALEKEKEQTSKRKPKKRKMKMRKLKLGDKLSLKEKEHLKLKRVDRRLGLARFRLAGKVMDKIRWRKSSQKKANSPDKTKEGTPEEPPAKEGGQASGEQQYEEEESEDNGRDQEEDEPSSQSLYEGMASALYPAALNPHTLPTGYMTSGFSGVMDAASLYPSPVLMPASTASPSDRRDLKKKHAKTAKAKRIKKSENVKEHIKEDHSQKTGSEKSGADQSEEVESGGETSEDEEDDQSSLKLNKTINHAIEATTAASSALKSANLLQPVFAPNARQLTPLYSLLTLTNGAQNRLAISPSHPLLAPAGSTATLPLFTPAKPTLDSSAALLLKLIEHQSHQQQQLIRAQQAKLLEQEVRQKQLTKQLQQATEDKQKEKLLEEFPKDDEPPYEQVKERLNERTKENDKSKLLYANELDYWDKFVEDDKYTRANRQASKYDKYDKASINRLRRRKSEENRSDQSTHPADVVQKSKPGRLTADDEFNFSDFDEDLESVPNQRLRSRQQRFERRAGLYSEPQFDESQPIANVTAAQTNGPTDKRADSDPASAAINEVKLARNASLIVYGY